MYSESERAAFAVLLARARANDDITQDEVEGILPADLFPTFLALSIKHENDVIDRYDEEVATKWHNDPDTIDYYKKQLEMSKQAYRAAPLKLEKLMVKPSHKVLFDRNLGILVHQKDIMWRLYNELSETDKLWTKPDSTKDGWPPELVEEPPMKVVLPDVELPAAFALRRLLSGILGEQA